MLHAEHPHVRTADLIVPRTPERSGDTSGTGGSAPTGTPPVTTDTSTTARPRLIYPRLSEDAPPDGIALILHGGRAKSTDPVGPGSLAALRMVPFAHAIQGTDVAPVLLRNRLRGWNAPSEENPEALPDPVADALWALDQLKRRFGPVPVVLVGHSLGGRTALRVAGHPAVRGVAALAPWLPPAEPVAQLAARSLLVAHGTADRVTDSKASMAFAREAAPLTTATYIRLLPGGHAMTRYAHLWHRLVRDFAVNVLSGTPAAALDGAELVGGTAADRISGESDAE
jgi:pimeloyl-ACP methyl ester carboxylesterase